MTTEVKFNTMKDFDKVIEAFRGRHQLVCNGKIDEDGLIYDMDEDTFFDLIMAAADEDIEFYSRNSDKEEWKFWSNKN